MSSRFSYSASANKHIEAASAKAVETATLAIAEDARKIVPVDTGNLRDSIGSKVEGSKGVVYAEADYAPDVELGTSKMRAQPFLKPAAYQHRSL